MVNMDGRQNTALQETSFRQGECHEQTPNRCHEWAMKLCHVLHGNLFMVWPPRLR